MSTVNSETSRAQRESDLNCQIIEIEWKAREIGKEAAERFRTYWENLGNQRTRTYLRSKDESPHYDVIEKYRKMSKRVVIEDAIRSLNDRQVALRRKHGDVFTYLYLGFTYRRHLRRIDKMRAELQATIGLPTPQREPLRVAAGIAAGSHSAHILSKPGYSGLFNCPITVDTVRKSSISVWRNPPLYSAAAG